jgi:hypothetical protein
MCDATCTGTHLFGAALPLLEVRTAMAPFTTAIVRCLARACHQCACVREWRLGEECVRSRSAASQPCSSICMSSQARNTTCLPFVSLSPCPLSLIVPVTRTRAHTRVHFRHAPLLHRHCLHSCWMNRICGRGFSRHDDRTRSALACMPRQQHRACTPLSKNGHMQQPRVH